MHSKLKNIPAFSSLSEQAIQLLAKHVTHVNYPKGSVLIQEGKIAPYFYIIESGIARAYSDGKNQQITFWFGQDNDLLFSYNSYINNIPGYESIELLENSRLYRIKCADLISLYADNIEIANWGRKLAEKELISTEKRLIDRLFKPAKERYAEFIMHTPGLAQRVALKHIASYLGVTQVTLSRIRTDVK